MTSQLRQLSTTANKQKYIAGMSNVFHNNVSIYRGAITTLFPKRLGHNKMQRLASPLKHTVRLIENTTNTT